MEYAVFGNGYVQRENADHEWAAVPPDDVDIAKKALADKIQRDKELAEKIRRTPFAKIIRKEDQ